jgi:hypothetical protein
VPISEPPAQHLLPRRAVRASTHAGAHVHAGVALQRRGGAAAARRVACSQAHVLTRKRRPNTRDWRLMADAAALERSPFALLPHALLVKVLLLLPVDARAVCATVCTSWYCTLADRTLWTRLDLSPAGGVARERVTDALLRGAAAKARGGLTVLDVSERPRVTHEALLAVVTANAGALTELRAWHVGGVSAEQAEALLGAAPALRVYHADVTRVPAAATGRMLRNEPPFGPLRMHELFVSSGSWPGGDEDSHASEAGVRAFAADLTASASPLSHLSL